MFLLKPAKKKIVILEYTIKIKHYQLTLKWYVPKNLKKNELTVKTAGDNNEEISVSYTHLTLPTICSV